MASKIQDVGAAEFAAAVNAAFGKKLQQCRVRKGMTQVAVADRAALSRVSVANIESGRQNVSLHQLFALALSMDVPLTELVPVISDVERSLLGVPDGPSGSGLSLSDSRFLEETRAMLIAMIRSPYANPTAETRD